MIQIVGRDEITVCVEQFDGSVRSGPGDVYGIALVDDSDRRNFVRALTGETVCSGVSTESAIEGCTRRRMPPTRRRRYPTTTTTTTNAAK
ncbi:hypothetical protein D8S78_20830 [Natrialba swarupiae]|nr:hypothetical protein [Natrialba swarupiae]